MPLLWIRLQSELNSEINIVDDIEFTQWSSPLNVNVRTVVAWVSIKDESSMLPMFETTASTLRRVGIYSQVHAEVTDSLNESLHSKEQVDAFPQSAQEEFFRITKELARCSQQLAAIIHFEFTRPWGQASLSRLRGNTEYQWSDDGAKWSVTRTSPVIWVGDLMLRPRISADQQRAIQTLLDNGEVPLLATEFLNEAYRVTSSKQKWVSATIAAELAIKEVLIRIEPSFEVLLRDLPSPPIHKLYGSILESVAGVKSPFVKELQKGVEKRNRIVHSPGPVTITFDEVKEYRDVVGSAIAHLIYVMRCKRFGFPINESINVWEHLDSLSLLPFTRE